MRIVDSSVKDAEQLVDTLRKFLENFDGLHLDVRLNASQKILESIKTFFQHQAILVEHAFHKNPEYRQRFLIFDKNHDEYEEITEKLLMMHVDEPDYRNQFIHIYDRLQVYTQPEYQQFLEAIQQSFTDDDERIIVDNMARVKPISPVHPV